MSATSARPTVLLVHEDAVVRSRVESLLGEMDYPFVAVEDGEAMWTSFSASAPEIVITGLRTPGVDPFELCRRIRERADGLCFVLVVIEVTEFALSLALAAGADDYLETPIAANQLRARMEIAERRLSVAKARRMAEAEAARFRWLAGIGQKCLTLSHEINNPLTVLYGLLETVAMDSNLPAGIADDVKTSLEQAKRIAGIVRRFAADRNQVPDSAAERPTRTHHPFMTFVPTHATPRISP